MNKLLLIDGHSVAYRAYFAMQRSNLSTSNGTPTGMIYGFCSMLTSMLTHEKPTHIAVAFDRKEKTFRHNILPTYKANREKPEPDFLVQLDILKELLRVCNITQLSLAGFEADDILASVSKKASNEGCEVVVSSGDRDTFQIIDKNVNILFPMREMRHSVLMDDKAVFEKYGVHAVNYPDLAALTGETSDNIPGVPGVGPKKAAKLLQDYGSLENVLENADSIKGKLGESIKENVDAVRRNRNINRLKTDLDLGITLNDLEYKNADANEIISFLQRLEFKGTVYNDLLKFCTGADSGSSQNIDANFKKSVPAAFSTNKNETVSNLLEKLDSDCESYAVDVQLYDYLEQIPYRTEAKALCIFDGKTAVKIILSDLNSEDERALSSFLQSGGTNPNRDTGTLFGLFEIPDAEKLYNANDSKFICYDYKTLAHSLYSRGFRIENTKGDIKIASYVVNSDLKPGSLYIIAQKYLNLSPETLELIEPKTEKAYETFVKELSDDEENSISLLRLRLIYDLQGVLSELLVRTKQEKLYERIEIPLAKILVETERAGIEVDTNVLSEQADISHSYAEQSQAAAYKLIGKEINLSSPAQLQKVLFEDLKMPKTKRNVRGYSTDANSLKHLLKITKNEFLVQLLAYRDAIKNSQIIENLLNYVGDDNKIHTTLLQTNAATGRLASRNPNLQNIPTADGIYGNIRKSLTAGKNRVLFCADYSQIEMRILAHMSGDKYLIQAFNDDVDLHTFVAARVFNVDESDVTHELRSKVKAVSYGLAYGLTVYGLAKQLDISINEAQKIHDDYFTQFKSVHGFFENVVKQAKSKGYTSTIFGRRRYFQFNNPSAGANNENVVRRAALNAPIQGSAADIIKKAMIDVDREFRKNNLRSKQVLQIHDELMIDAFEDELNIVRDIVVNCMENTIKLDVPLKVAVGTGKNWAEAGH